MSFSFLWIVFFASTGIQFLYLLFIFGRLAYFKKISKKTAHEVVQGVSVVIAARNEDKNLAELVPLLRQQNYPKFEILIVNDQSSDDTEPLLEKMLSDYPELRTVTIRYTPEHVTSKKYALTLGIKTAKFDVILLTDADCRPVSLNWIHKMTHPVIQENKTFSLGHSSYLIEPGVLNRIIQFETIFTAISYFSFSLWKAPFMGIGRNLCYRKSFFMEKKAFRNLWHIQGGDDDLFVNQYANSKNTAVVIDPESITVSIPKRSFKEYNLQKRRHFHAGKYYKTIDKLKLGFYSFSHMAFWVSGISLLAISRGLEPIAVLLGLITLRALLQYTVIRGARKKLEGVGKVFWTMFFDLMYLSYFWLNGTRGYLSKTVKWK